MNCTYLKTIHICVQSHSVLYSSIPAQHSCSLYLVLVTTDEMLSSALTLSLNTFKVESEMASPAAQTKQKIKHVKVLFILEYLDWIYSQTILYNRYRLIFFYSVHTLHIWSHICCSVIIITINIYLIFPELVHVHPCAHTCIVKGIVVLGRA